MSPDKSTRGVINAADLAVSEQDYDTAENALLKALSRVRRRKQKGGTNE